jgi:hypothetical protein
MTERAHQIYEMIRNRARIMGEVREHRLVCRYNPTSNTFNWWKEGAPRDITNNLRKPQIIAAIEISMDTTKGAD